MTIEYHPAVFVELEAVRDYYEEKSPGLGAQFIEEFERQVIRIAAAPCRWMALDADLRRALMRRFPYVIYFRMLGADRVRIMVVKHQRRHPDLGRSRH